ncbi:protein obstructor-E [Ixodes scapularis]|uniref:Peritrophin A, putative n=1 Tax=Ixodes scapularis TaxID=6945 RepID=B7QE82_IXOSC|nr:protein obstructor-E [Ixodes scapularis]EEC17154.1 peritrophin A, putative [Ixodes scapularis]|eukprot:XP_002413846.1 peritrophin A, putative [Ixodes scapularis]
MAPTSTLLAFLGVLLGTALVCVLGEFVCPSKNGFFPDPEQCDMYYECRKGVAKPKLCGDGMAFLDNNPLYARCDFLSNVDCSKRPYLQEAKSTPKCPRANGYFPHEDPQNCAEFYTCSNGVPSKLNCQKGLAFNPQVGGCEWAGRVPGCEHEARNAQVPSGVSTTDSADVDE